MAEDHDETPPADAQVYSLPVGYGLPSYTGYAAAGIPPPGPAQLGWAAASTYQPAFVSHNDDVPIAPSAPPPPGKGDTQAPEGGETKPADIAIAVTAEAASGVAGGAKDTKGPTVVASAPAPPEPSPHREVGANNHTCLGFLNFFALLWLIIMIASIDDSKGLGVAAKAICPISWALYVVVACCSDTHKFLRNQKPCREGLAELQAYKDAPPRVIISCRSSHTETRHYTEHYTDSKGRSHTRHKTKTVTVTTARGTRLMRFRMVADASDSLLGIETNGVTLVKYTKARSFGDQATSDAFTHEFQLFQESYRRRDRSLTAHEHLEIPNFKSEHMLLGEPGTGTISLAPWQYMLASCLYLAWPIAWYVESNSVRVTVRVVKVLSDLDTSIAPGDITHWGRGEPYGATA